MRDIALTMITIDRSPGTNYLYDTLRNLRRGGVWDAERFHSLHLCNSTIESRWARQQSYTFALSFHRPNKDLLPSLNVAAALRAGYSTGCKWIVFLEDDIDVCDFFIESVSKWLDLHQADHFRVYSFGANYDAVKITAASGGTYWQYPVTAFYGTQCFAIRRDDALSLSHYLEDNPLYKGTSAGAYDLILQEWSKYEYPQLKNFLASAPSFVQHIGRHSIINPRQDVHSFPSWPGRNWTFTGHKSAMNRT